ncbi:MAG: transposase [Nitrospirota bacterium]
MPAPSAKGSFVQGYNGQAAVDATAQIIVAAEVTDDPNDKQQAQPLLTQVLVNTEQVPRIASLDAGYFSEATVEALAALGCEPLIPPDRQLHGQVVAAAPRDRPPAGLSAAHVANEARAAAVRSAQGDCGAGVRTDQAGPRLSAVLAARPAERARGVGAHLYHPQ